HDARLDARGPASGLLRSRSEEGADDGAGAAALPFDLLDPAVGVDVSAGGDSVRQVRQRGALLGVDRAPHAAVAGAQALPDVAAGGVHLPSELLASVIDGAVVRIRVLVVDLLDPQAL